MAGLFGSAAASSSAASSAQGDLKNDVQMKDTPEDSISDLAFSPQSDHLAVASWDKKVRIYEIDAQGNSQGKALFEMDGPVLSCAWSRVRARQTKLSHLDEAANISRFRMDPKSWPAVPTSKPKCWTSHPATSQTQPKSPRTTNQYAASKCSNTKATPCSSPVPGTKPSNTGISANKHPPQHSNAKTASTPWTCETNSSSSAQRSDGAT